MKLLLCRGALTLRRSRAAADVHVQCLHRAGVSVLALPSKGLGTAYRSFFLSFFLPVCISVSPPIVAGRSGM